MIKNTIFSPSELISVLTTKRCVLTDSSEAISRATFKCEGRNFHQRFAGERILFPKGVCEFRFGTYAIEKHPV